MAKCVPRKKLFRESEGIKFNSHIYIYNFMRTWQHIMTFMVIFVDPEVVSLKLCSDEL